ncbi:MAG: RNA 2',3'-cyclic phosphodiesterase [Desulfobacterales bacterium]|nr:RNA 2',3'-cyclic phosphodiesterase [Desulfobacterales bacterium]MDD4070762.1 RNA 2',3'-cyclic phosphodiesterase [Desulfobacterales bacterium]MDD4391164.1 RNA 2',3'-cyclic phosphodiesterase [Desulfobacterales bacterium]
MPDTIRAFIAADLPEPIILSLRQLQDDLKPFNFDARWVKPDHIHLTLKFLGDIRSADAETVGRVITETAILHAPVSLVVKGIGVFPEIRRPRVLWVGIDGQISILSRLQKTIEDQLETVGFPREKRAFKGHLTLARFRYVHDPGSIIAAMTGLGGFETQPFTVNAVHLYKSRLTPAGAEYTRLVSAELTR